MTNERLRTALIGSALTAQSLSERIGVDPKTVERWITNGRLPHRTHRLAVASELRTDDVFLWPETETDPRTRTASQSELVAIHANRGAVATLSWTAALDSAVESIDLLAFAASFLHDTIPDFDERLLGKARQGVQVRLLFGDPNSDAVAVRGAEEGIGDLLTGRVNLTWRYLAPLLDQPGILARMHSCTLYNSIFRFDDTLFANTHVYGAAASQSPLLHLHRIAGGRLFSNFMNSFERVWDQSKPAQADAAA